MMWQGRGNVVAERSRALRLGVALALLGLLSVAALADRDVTPAQAKGDSSTDCVTVPLGADQAPSGAGGGRAICTYLDATSVDLTALLASVEGSQSLSGIWIQAWGGRGSDGEDYTSKKVGGGGGAGGYAQSYYDNLSSYTGAFGAPGAFYFYYGGNGTVRADSTGVRAGGAGGASTLVASADVTEGTGPDYGPCIAEDASAVDQDGNPVEVEFHSANGALCQQSVVVLAGGGGGGGAPNVTTNNSGHSGKSGGSGGSAVAGGTTTVGRGIDGDSAFPKRAGVGGFAGNGGHNRKFSQGDGGDGIGGLGGPFESSSDAESHIGTFLGPAFVGGETNGGGGRAYDPAAAFGGGGGGGFGGGGGGGGASVDGDSGASGGGGGGSYAYTGNPLPDFAGRYGPPATGAPSADQGAVRVVIDWVGQPEASPPFPPPCTIALHGTGNSETLTGTTGGDAMYGYGGADSIVAGPGDDCTYGGAGGDTMQGGRGGDVLVADRNGAQSASLTGERLRGGYGYGYDALKGGRGADEVVGEAGHNLLKGGRGADEIDAEGGKHEVHGGRGADRIHARDGKPDTVSCGPGHDEAWVDARDSVARSCETVHARA